MLTSEKSPQSLEPQNEGLVMWNEATFEEKCTYIVKDQPLEEESENNSKTRAERSLPRNLALKRCHNSGEVCMLRVQLYETKSRPIVFTFYALTAGGSNACRLNPRRFFMVRKNVQELFWSICASRQHPSIHVSILRQEEPDMLLSNFSPSSVLWVCSGKERGKHSPGSLWLVASSGFPGQNNTVKESSKPCRHLLDDTLTALRGWAF